MQALPSLRSPSVVRGLTLRVVWVAMLLVIIGGAVFGAEDFLDPERAFVLSARAIDARQVEIRFEVAPGYYLYRDQFKFRRPTA